MVSGSCVRVGYPGEGVALMYNCCVAHLSTLSYAHTRHRAASSVTRYSTGTAVCATAWTGPRSTDYSGLSHMLPSVRSTRTAVKQTTVCRL